MSFAVSPSNSTLSESVTVPYGSFDNVLKTKEFSCIEAGVDYKYYAPGVGFVQSIAGGSGDETLQLTGIK